MCEFGLAIGSQHVGQAGIEYEFGLRPTPSLAPPLGTFE